jgi:hypothetical protein
MMTTMMPTKLSTTIGNCWCSLCAVSDISSTYDLLLAVLLRPCWMLLLLLQTVPRNLLVRSVAQRML